MFTTRLVPWLGYFENTMVAAVAASNSKTMGFKVLYSASDRCAAAAATAGMLSIHDVFKIAVDGNRVESIGSALLPPPANEAAA